MKNFFYLELVYLFLLGAITSLSLPPYNYFLINFITFSLFFYFLHKKENIKNISFLFYGWSFGFGYFVTNLYWISISLTFDKSFKILIPISLILIPALLALFYGISAYLFSFLKKKKTASSFLLFSILFGIIEIVRGYIFTGFPWNLIVYSFSNNIEFILITSIIGTYSLNIFCISLFTSPALIFLKNEKKNITIFLFFLFSFILIYFYGHIYKKNFFKAEKESNSIVIRAIGSNITLDRFYKDTDPFSTINELINISKPNKDKLTLFLWPEGIVPGILQDQLVEYQYLFKNNFNNNHLIGLGINHRLINDKNEKFYNSFSIYDHKLNLINSYNKINLVPFGEFLPFEKLLKKIGLKTITNNYNSFSKGDKRNSMSIKIDNISLKILPLICYEIIYSGKLYNNDNFDYLINISEDGWFGKSIGPKQHFAHSIFRAIESGKYLIRSANNGTAAIINPIGIIEKQVDYGKNGFIDLEEVRKIQPTIFSKFGNKIFFIIILLYIFLIFSFNRIDND